MSLSFEQGPIRPPSEAGSLLIRISRNCPWNRCAFRRTYKNEKFEPRGDEEILREIGEFISCLEGIETTMVSDHILNLLEEIEGTLPRDKKKMLDVLEGYFSLPEEQRLVFRLGRRTGIYRRLADLSEQQTVAGLKNIIDRYEAMGEGALEKHLTAVLSRYI